MVQLRYTVEILSGNNIFVFLIGCSDGNSLLRDPVLLDQLIGKNQLSRLPNSSLGRFIALFNLLSTYI